MLFYLLVTVCELLFLYISWRLIKADDAELQESLVRFLLPVRGINSYRPLGDQ